LEMLGLTKSETCQEFKKCKDALATLETEYKAATETLRRLEDTRTMCRVTHLKAVKEERSEAYAALKSARSAVACHRKENAELEKQYHELKEQVWIWSQLKRAKPAKDDHDGDSA
ncbi:hypothetical protein EC968_000809, partial [Mortierella alpina]